jgi:hypothetical protein
MELDEKTAFKAMTLFLEDYWNRVGRPGELGDLLSGLQLLADGQPMDPAHWADWLRALEAARAVVR